jgi:hypothetical protein
METEHIRESEVKKISGHGVRAMRRTSWGHDGDGVWSQTEGLQGNGGSVGGPQRECVCRI